LWLTASGGGPAGEGGRPGRRGGRRQIYQRVLSITHPSIAEVTCSCRTVAALYALGNCRGHSHTRGCKLPIK
jgi:hypothetical protein